MTPLELWHAWIGLRCILVHVAARAYLLRYTGSSA